MKKVLITGGAGFIGYHLTRYLLQEGYEVTIIDNFARAKKDVEFIDLTKNKNLTFIDGDITDKNTFEDIHDDFDYVYHLAAINGTKNFYNIPDKVISVILLGTLNVLEWFSKKKTGKLFFASSSETYAGAYGLLGDKFPIPTPEEVPLVINDPSNPRFSYAAGKIASEVAIFSYAKAHGINFTIVRYHNIYGPRMGNDHVIPEFIARAINKENPFVIYGGKETRTFCYVDDAVVASRLVMESKLSDGKIINIGCMNEEIDMLSLAKKITRMTKFGQSISFDIKPAPIGSVLRRCPDITKLRGLGFEPKVSLDDGLSKTYEWYKKNMV